MYPLKLSPVFKEIVWGGNRLKDDFGFETDLKNIAEAWMLTARKDGDNIILNGDFSGKLFTEYLKENPEVVGSKAKSDAEFPLLIKFIDAKTDLSIQVHPDDEYAQAHEDCSGKTEAWFILDCTEGAELVYGFNTDIDRETLRLAIEDGTFEKYIKKVKVKKGDIYFIPSGTLHAICGGILLAEVQQNCAITYRVYDYKRLVDGVLRPLHIDKALDVVHTAPPSDIKTASAPVTDGDAVFTDLCECEFFKMTTLELNGAHTLNVGDESFLSILVYDGSGEIAYGDNILSVNKGDSIFVPANLGSFTVKGNFKALLSTM